MDNVKSENRYVAFFDILGFKEAVRRNFDEAWGALEDMRVSMEETLNLFIKLPNQIILTRANDNDNAIGVNFSDSILIFTKSDTVEDLHRLLVVSCGFFAKSLSRCIPLRGGIAYGLFKFNFEKSLYAGPAFLDAYKICEEAQWSGIVVDDTIAEHYRLNPLTSNSQEVIQKWPLECKDGGKIRKKNHRVFAWPIVCKQNFKVTDFSAYSYAKAFESLLGSQTKWSSRDIKKYENTVEFIKKFF